MDLEPLITDKQTASLLGCSRATVWRWVADGTLPQPIRIGRTARFAPAEIKAVIARAMEDRTAV